MKYEQRLKAAAEYVISNDNRIDEEEQEIVLNSNEFGVTASLKPHQIEGVCWLIRRYLLGVNVILGDEMGLGKTLQAIAFLSYLKVRRMVSGPYLVLCPLSVVDGWISEVAKFCPGLRVLRYIGDKEIRRGLRRTMYENVNKQSSISHEQSDLPFDVLLTTYDIVLMDQDFLCQIPWHYAVIDEAQRLKNPSSVLYSVLEQRFIIPRRLLMTGTPIQNNLSELWALMHFCLPKTLGPLEQFLSTFKEAANPSSGHDDSKVKEQFKILKFILGAFMLRRTKSVLIESGTLVLPPLTEITVMAPLVSLQKKVYLSILRKELPKLLAFSSGATGHQSLQNIVIQLRKTCSHPYLFPGIEPEPYEEGEHLIEASGKLIILDQVLQKLHVAGHRVLLFAQMTHTLDILQDFLELRKYTYERLDGSVRAEERFAAIRSFSHQPDKVFLDSESNQQGAFVFMISTRAGGVGLNLVAADTVIFYEQDWNPQVDRQALQRAHRIGQMNHVLSINLVIMRRAERKLQLSHNVVGENNIDNKGEEMGIDNGDLRSVIYGLHMFDFTNVNDEESDEVNMTELSAMTERLTEMRHVASHEDNRKFEVNPNEFFKGRGISMKTDSTTVNFDRGLDESSYMSWVEKFKEISQLNDNPTPEHVMRRNILDEKQKKLETARKKTEEEKMQKWEALGYQSLGVQDPVCDMQSQMMTDSGSVQFVYGDCTHPSNVCPSESTIIFSCVDNSGNWGHGGMFNALAKLAPSVPDAYQQAFQFKDLHMGDLHLIKISEDHDEKAGTNTLQWVALAVVQSYSTRRKIPRSNISIPDLESEEILNPSVPMALRLSGILMGGVVIVYERKVKLLYDDVSRLLVELNEAWKIKPVADPTILPKGKSQAKYAAVTLPDQVGDDTVNQSLNFSNTTTASLGAFQPQSGEYFTMRLDRIDERDFNVGLPGDEDLFQDHHQADAANITLLDPFDSYQQAGPSLLDRFERFDIEGDDDTQMNFGTQEYSGIPSLIPSPPRQEVPPEQVDEMMHDLHPEPQNNQHSAEDREEAEQEQPKEKKPVVAKRRARQKTRQAQMDYEQTIIPGPVYQSWLQNSSDIVGRRGGKKKHIKPISLLKTAHLMELPPTSLINGFSGLGTTKVHYPAPLLDLFMKCAQHQLPCASSSRSFSPQQSPAPLSPLAPPHDEGPLQFPVEDFLSGIGSHPKQVSIEKQMETLNLNNIEFPINDFNMMSTPGNSGGSNERSVPSSGSGNGPLPPEPVDLPFERSSKKRATLSRRSGGSDLDPVAEEDPRDLLERTPKLRRLSEDGPFGDHDVLMETGPTQSQLPLLDHPIDKMTDVVRKHLKTHFDTPGNPAIESLDHLTSGMNRKRAALLFYQTCVLATHEFLKVKQAMPYGEILISKGLKM
ncbi:Chromatin remodeling [Thalictrum thalictroides]|uniref:Chromatin remodeling n=1 Tax=Thalictrum thalictroides TaxID=46969 RepID=A0A7J6WAF1_THATH|nr:Chromatin remodeling [Thalictrum thalictroides]